MSTDTLAAAVAEVVAANPAEWERLVEGDDKLYQFFTGQVMRITKGQANGEAVRSELDRLKG